MGRTSAPDLPKTVALSLDNNDPKEGHSSLRVDFNGATKADGVVISQLVLVGAKTHYKLQLAFRTAGIVFIVGGVSILGLKK